MESNNEMILNIKFKICDNINYIVSKDRVVTVYEKQDHKIQKIFRKLRFNIPMYKEIILDEYSSEVFLQIDGCKTVKEIGQFLEKKYGENVYPLYERLLVFLNYINVECRYIEKLKY